MKTTNRLDTSFGPSGTFAGRVLLVAGAVMTFFYVPGILLVIIGGFVGLTYSSAVIDYDRRRVKFSNNLFGIIPTGKWMHILPTMTIGIKKANQVYGAYSQGNRALDVTKSDFRIALFDSDEKELVQVDRADTLDSAIVKRDSIGNRLGLSRI